MLPDWNNFCFPIKFKDQLFQRILHRNDVRPSRIRRTDIKSFELKYLILQSQISNIKVLAGGYLVPWSEIYIILLLYNINTPLREFKISYFQDGFTVPVVEKIETSNLLPKFPRSCSLQDNTIAHSKVGLALKWRVLIPNQ